MLPSEADYSRITVEFVLAGAALIVPRNTSNRWSTGAMGSFNMFQRRRGGGLFPDL